MRRPDASRGGPRSPRRPRGFTLVEALVASALLGLGVAALMVAASSSTRVNAAGLDMTQAAFLAQEVREWTLRLPFSDPDPGDEGNPPGPDGADPQTFVDDLDDLMGMTYSPPRNAAGDPIDELSGWSQTITLEWVDPNALTTVVSPGGSDCIRVTVSIQREGRQVQSTQWLVTRGQS